MARIRGRSMGRVSASMKRKILSKRGGFVGKVLSAANSLRKNKQARALTTKYLPNLESSIRMGESLVNTLTVNGKYSPLYSTEVRGSSGAVSETEYTSSNNKTPIAKAVFAMSQRNTYATNASYRLVSTIGNQAVGSMGNAISSSLLATTDRAPAIAGLFTGNVISLGTPGVIREGVLSQMNVLANNANIGPYRTTQKIYFQGCQVETEISNLTLTPIRVDIYEVVAKHDLSGTNNVIGDELTGYEIYDPAAFWGQGLLNTTALTGSGLAYTNTTSTPYDSQLFNTYWKVASKVSVNLAAGDLHRHTSTYKLNKVLDAQRFSYSSILQGITRNIMIVIQGTPVNDQTNVGRIRIGPALCNINHDISYKFMTIADSKEATYYENTQQPVTIAKDTVVDGPTAGVTIPQT